MKIIDATLAGKVIHSFTLDSLTEKMSVREIIKARIWQETQDYNRKNAEIYKGLVQPKDSEAILNGYKLKKQKEISWEEQFNQACEAFDRNGFFILIDDYQAVSLEEVVSVRVDTEVSFIKLVPMVGG
jgi:hypothetical protein